MSKDFDDYKKHAKEIADRSKKDSFKLEPGDNCIRVLTTPKGKKSSPVVFEFAVHENVGPEKKYVRCGKHPISGKGSDIICDKIIPKLEKRGKETRAAQLAPKTKVVVQVARISDSGKWTGPHLFYPSGKVATELMTLLNSKKRDYVDPKRGYNLNIHRTGTGFKDTRYGAVIPDDESSKVPSKILDKLVSFDQLKSIPTYEESRSKKAYYGEDYDEDEDDDLKKSKRSRDDEDDDEEDDDDDEDDARSKKKKKSKKSRDEDDDEDEDADEDDKKKKKKKKKSKSKSKKSKDEDDADDDEDEDDDDDDDEDEDEDEDDDDDDEDEDDDDETPSQKRRRLKKEKLAKKKKKSRR